MDEKLFFVIHGLAGHWSLVDLLAIFFAKYAVYFFASVVAFFLWYKRRTLSDVVVSLSIAVALNQGIGHFFFRARPFVTFHLQPLIHGVSAGKSFPSDHTALSFALATVFALAYPRWRWCVYAGALAIGCARIFVGVHYPGDILGGIVVGIFSGLISGGVTSHFVCYWKKCHGK